MALATKYEREFKMISDAYEKSGGDASKFLNKDIVSVIVSGDKLIGRNTVEGVDLRFRQIEDGVELWIEIRDNVRLKQPIHLCTGFMKEKGRQMILIHNRCGRNSEVRFLSHCVFPHGLEFTHKMIADTEVGEDSKLSYEDVHFHSDTGGVSVEATYNTLLRRGAEFGNYFNLTQGRVGKLRVKMKVDLQEDSSAQIESKVYERADDDVHITEELNLNGERASGLARTIVFATDKSKATIINRAYGNAPYSRAHIECKEIIKGDEVNVGTVPVLFVRDEKAELTHEASIGRVNLRQLETLMAKGLNEEEATEMIIRGLLR